MFVKSLVRIILLPVVIIFLVACSSSDGRAYDYDYDEYDNGYEYCQYEITECETELLLIAEMACFLAAIHALWDADDGAMWGVPLHTPIIFVDDTRVAVASHPDWQGEFVRQYFDDVPVYVGTRWPPAYYSYLPWDGQTGVVWSWRYVQSHINEESRESILRLITHSGFHARQLYIMGFKGASPAGLPHGTEAWISFNLEASALAQALRSTGDERLAIIHDALSIRHARRQAFDSAYAENWLQISEGTAVYTETVLVHGSQEAVDVIIERLEMLIGMSNSATRAALDISYAGGAAYGILLDDFGIDWRPYVDRYADLGLMLKEGLGITEFIPLEEIDLEKYGYSEIAARRRL